MSVAMPTQEELRTRIARNLDALLATKGIRARDLARRVGVAPSYIARIRAGERMPSTDVLVRIARVLNVPTSVLLGEEIPTGTPTPQDTQDDVLRDVLEHLRREEKEMVIDFAVFMLQRRYQTTKRRHLDDEDDAASTRPGRDARIWTLDARDDDETAAARESPAA